MAASSLALASTLVLVVLLQCTVVSYGASASERQALTDFYYATNGSRWFDSKNWLNNDPCAQRWFGVYCQDSVVVSLSLPRNNLYGTIPSTISGLSNLLYLDLNNNYNLAGSLPSELGAIKTLVLIYAHNSQLSGSIPSSFGQLIRLEGIRVFQAHLSGSIPASLAKLPLLQEIDLSVNNLDGSLPEFNSYTLDKIILNNNNLTGTIPTSFGALNVTFLNLSNNHLTGSIPVSLAQMQSVNTLDLSYNRLEGSIPSRFWAIRGNSYCSMINNCAYSINLSNNKLSGTIPAGQWGTANLDLSDNILIGTIPDFANSTYGFGTIKLTRNRLTGTIPATLEAFNTINLDENELQSPFPTFLQSQPSFKQVTMMYNNFTCPLPNWCDVPPRGSGVCSPCSSAVSKLCCLYNTGSTGESAVCVDNAKQCPSVTGWMLISSRPITDCNQCKVPTAKVDAESTELGAAGAASIKVKVV